MLDYIKEYYLMGLYTDGDLDIFVSAGMLTVDQENEIKTAKATDSTSASESASSSMSSSESASASTSENTSATATTSETAASN